MSAAIDALKNASACGVAGFSMEAVAMTLVEGGWPVFPCGLDKAPLVAGGFKARSKDLEQVRKWWATRPDAMPAIVPGDQGLAAFDIDSTNAFQAFDKAGSFDFVVETAGTSVPFEAEVVVGDGETDKVKVAPCHVYMYVQEQPQLHGVVVRYQAGYVIAPGARRGDRVYKVVKNAEPQPWGALAQLKRVSDRVRDEIAGLADVTRVAAAVNHVPNTEDTDRTLYVAMAHMIHGSVGDAGRDIFLDWAARYPGYVNRAEDERVWDSLPESKLGWHDLWLLASKHGFDAQEEVVADAQKDFGAPGVLETLAVMLNEDPEQKVIAMLERVRDAKNAVQRTFALKALRIAGYTEGDIRAMMAELIPVTSEEAIWYEDLLKMPELLVDPTPAIASLTWPGMKTLLAGHEKVGKSTLIAAGVAAASNGAEFLGLVHRPTRILWLTEEPYGIYAKRGQLFGYAEGRRVAVVGMGSNPMAQLWRAVEQIEPQVVIIDTLYRFANVQSDNENDAGTWTPVLFKFDELTRAGIALLLSHHMQRHGTEYRGSSAIGGFVDVILEMQKPKDRDRVRRISGRGRLNFGQPFAVRLLEDGKTFELMADSAAMRREQLEREVLTIIRETPGLSKNKIAEAVGHNKTDVLAAVDQLFAAGEIAAVGKGWVEKDELTDAS